MMITFRSDSHAENQSTRVRKREQPIILQYWRSCALWLQGGTCKAMTSSRLVNAVVSEY